MGITFARARLSNPRKLRRALDVDMLVDTGAIYSVVPRDVLKRLGVRSEEQDDFTLADGSTVTYPVGEARFEIRGRHGTSKVVFGPRGGTPLLGALALESLGLMVNPVTRELRPMRLILAAGTSVRPRQRISAAGRGLVMSSPSMISATRCGGTFNRSSYVARIEAGRLI